MQWHSLLKVQTSKRAQFRELTMVKRYSHAWSQRSSFVILLWTREQHNSCWEQWQSGLWNMMINVYFQLEDKLNRWPESSTIANVWMNKIKGTCNVNNIIAIILRVCDTDYPKDHLYTKCHGKSSECTWAQYIMNHIAVHPLSVEHL